MRIFEPAICRTCGCSHTRLGISEENAVSLFHQGQRCHFCCQECLDVFETDPQKYLQETDDLVVCPACLAEKPLNRAVRFELGHYEVHFCRCPKCVEVFRENPEFYVKRLQGDISNNIQSIIQNDQNTKT